MSGAVVSPDKRQSHPFVTSLLRRETVKREMSET